MNEPADSRCMGHAAPRCSIARPMGENGCMATAQAPSSPFAALGLADSLVAAVTALGYEEPTPVQRATIPLMLAAGDLLVQAATGTGKTAAFALPMIQRLMADGDAA